MKPSSVLVHPSTATTLDTMFGPKVAYMYRSCVSVFLFNDQSSTVHQAHGCKLASGSANVMFIAALSEET